MSSAGVEKRGSAATVKACDSCRKRKRRCLWTSGSARCTYCVQLSEECTTTHVRKPRGKPQKRDRIAEYEHRIKNLETLLQDRSVAQPHVQEQPLHRADDSVPLSTWTDNLRTEIEAFPAPILADLNPNDYTGPISAYGSGSSSVQAGGSELTSNETEGPFTIPVDVDLNTFEPSADFQEVADLLQDPTFQPSGPLVESIDDLTIQETPDVTDEKMSRCMASLPDPELGASLLTEFLVDFNTVFPLYRPYTIANHLRVCYEGGSDGTALAWASAYLVLGIAHRTRAMSTVATPQDNQMADWYLVRILPTISGLLTAPPSLGIVQCLLGLSMLIRSSSNTTPHALFTSTALRIAQTLAYEYFNVDCQDTEYDAKDVEQQRRVFWLAFIQDTEEGILSNIPTTQRREDITTELPEADPADSLGAVKAAEGDWKINLFALRVRLVLIQAEAIEDVLAIKSRKNTPQEMTATVERVLGRLEAWRDNEVCRLSPEELTLLLYRADVIHILSLEASYFATVFRLRSFVTLGLDPKTNPFSTQALSKLAAQKDQGCFVDAERVLNILSTTPHGETGICWMIKLPIIAALVTVLSYHLHALTAPPPSTTVSPTASSTTKASSTLSALAPPPTREAMQEYMRILTTLGMLAQQSGEVELQRGRELGMMIYTKVETLLRVKWLHGSAGKGEDGVGTVG